MSVNRVILIGRVGKQPEVKTTQYGKIANLSLATSKRWKDKESGERKEKTEWHNVSIKRDVLINYVESYVAKGNQIYVSGELETRKYTGSDGIERYATQVVALEIQGISGGEKPEQPAQSQADVLDDIMEQEIPF